MIFETTLEEREEYKIQDTRYKIQGKGNMQIDESN